MDGLWSAQLGTETYNQAEISRHRLLTVNVAIGGGMNARDQSSYAGLNPGSAAFTIPEGGPHFIMSPRAPEDSKSYGFEFCLLTVGGAESLKSFTAPNNDTGPFDITWWELIGVSMSPSTIIAATAQWASFQIKTGVNTNELYHTFDVNATMLRFQLGNFVAPAASGLGGSIMVAFCEL